MGILPMSRTGILPVLLPSQAAASVAPVDSSTNGRAGTALGLTGKMPVLLTGKMPVLLTGKMPVLL
jgi:hypothetical protein